MNAIESKTIGEFVAQDFRTAAVFSKYKIDFCCKGYKTIDEVCQKKGISKDVLEHDLSFILNSNNDSNINFNFLSANLLVDYILETHHRFIEEKTPTLMSFLDKLCKVHGERHPELFEIKTLFTISANDLIMHMKKEEIILFPFIIAMEQAVLSNQVIDKPHFGTVENPIAMLQEEHESEGIIFSKIALLTNDFTPPDDACNTFKVTYSMLLEFEQDLHKHIHLENNILFPKAINMEKQFYSN